MFKLIRFATRSSVNQMFSIIECVCLCVQKLLEAQEAERQQRVAEKRARDTERRIRLGLKFIVCWCVLSPSVP